MCFKCYEVMGVQPKVSEKYILHRQCIIVLVLSMELLIEQFIRRYGKTFMTVRIPGHQTCYQTGSSAYHSCSHVVEVPKEKAMFTVGDSCGVSRIQVGFRQCPHISKKQHMELPVLMFELLILC